MSKPKIEERILRLPESPEVWAMVNRPAPVWVEDDEDSGPMRPVVLAVLETSSGAVRYVAVGQRKTATSAELLGFLYDAMLLTPHPEAESVEAPDMSFEPCRPAQIVIEGVALAHVLAPSLRQVGVDCEGMERIDGIDEFLGDMRSHFNPDDVGGLARIPGMSVFNQQEFYAAAADYYARAPWKWMVNAHLIEFHYSADPKPALVAIMGNARQEFGLTRYADIHQVENMMAARMSGPLGQLHPAVLAETLAMRALLSFAVEITPSPDLAALIRAAYDPVLPDAARDPSHALRLVARMAQG